VTSKVFISVRVPVDPTRAFEVFTRDIGSWWRPDPLFQIAPLGDGALSFEPGPQGRLITHLHGGEIFEIGRISVWEPGKRLVFDWHHASFSRPDQTTEVEVRFDLVGEETRVSIEHRAWDTIPRRHVARHGFPEKITLQRVAAWWRRSLSALRTAASE